MTNEHAIGKTVTQNCAFYTLRWSMLKEVDLHEIRTIVPAQSGIYELYYRDENQRLALIDIAPAWYGGVRARLRSSADPELETNEWKKSILETYPCYYRYSLCESPDDMADVMHFLTNRYFPDYEPARHSGRYDKILIKEITKDKITEIRPGS